MAKNRSLNEIRQSKEYQTAKETVNTQSKNPFEHADVDKTVNKIVKDLGNGMYDLIFQAICDEMSEHQVFQDTNYFTEAGLELFEDQWFEFYHEHHGKIMHELLHLLK